MAVANADGRFVLVNEAFCRITGYNEAELLSRDWISITHPDDRQHSLFVTKRMEAGELPGALVETRCIRKDGTTVRVRNSTSLLQENGQRQWAISLVEDVTEHNPSSCWGVERSVIDPERVEKRMRDDEQCLRLMVGNGRMCGFEWDVESDTVVRTTDGANMLGLPTRGLGRHFIATLDADDRRQYSDAIAALAPGQDNYQTEYRILSNGSVCWVEERGHGLFDAEGRLIRVIGLVSEITERKQVENTLRMLSARLIRAQEEERKRVARELHDGVTQTLGVISIELARTAEAANGSHVAQRLSRIYAKLQEVVSDIGHISHELHPSTLRHVGLPVAIRNLCREVSETHGIAVEVTDKSAAAPQVSKDVALCLYRVAQEALQNIVKHSRSTRAWVELQGSSEEIALFVRDRGVGFSVEPSKGLGLVSMRERLRLVGGTIAIYSRAGFGTRIEARVPLSSALNAAA